MKKSPWNCRRLVIGRDLLSNSFFHNGNIGYEIRLIVTERSSPKTAHARCPREALHHRPVDRRRQRLRDDGNLAEGTP
jgi:hypothetical protein